MLAMRIRDSQLPSKPLYRTRRDGWTVERQLGFLVALARTRSITRAAAAVGMTRESAYRLRARPNGALFAAAWDRVLAAESHTSAAHATARTDTCHPARRAFRPKVTKVMKVRTPGVGRGAGGQT